MTIERVAAMTRAKCPDCWVREGLTLQDALAETIRPRRFTAWLFSGFGVAALLIVGTGILGIVALATSRRVREIGIRMALGATRRRVLTQLLREQCAGVLLGIAIGGLVASWATRFVATYLYKTDPLDRVAWIAAAAGIIVAACIGALIPAHRATRIDPVQALRAE
jgi:ABC-type antimicrobial peptide transport system permease subunit